MAGGLIEDASAGSARWSRQERMSCAAKRRYPDGSDGVQPPYRRGVRGSFGGRPQVVMIPALLQNCP
jgi:hypothetical protein